MGNLLQAVREELLLVFDRKPGGGIAKKGILQAFNNADKELELIIERYIHISLQNGISISFIAESYAFFLAETEKEQMYFYKEGHYRYSKLEEVIHKVYDDDTYMKKYMIGLALSILLWPQHVRLFNFFRTFIKKLDSKDSYLEVGAGHGIFCYEALLDGRLSRYDIVDISETSLALTRGMIEDFIGKIEIKFIHSDFLDLQNLECYDAVSISEVLEHVENPRRFLDKCKEVLKDDGRIYLTTCINAPEVDHIYLFETIREVEDLFTNTGWEIDEKIYVPYKNATIERCERQKLPINVAYVLKKGGIE